MPIRRATLPKCSPASVRPSRSATITAGTELAAALDAEASPGRRVLASVVADARTIGIPSNASGQLVAIERAERVLERLAPAHDPARRSPSAPASASAACWRLREAARAQRRSGRWQLAGRPPSACPRPASTTSGSAAGGAGANVGANSGPSGG
jgi:hypothetical protein